MLAAFTVTLTGMDCVPLAAVNVAVIVALPMFTPRMMPLASTVAMLGALDVNDTVPPDDVTKRVVDRAASIESVVGVTWKSATHTVAEPAVPPLVAVIVA